MSTNAENAAHTPALPDSERADELITIISLNLIQKRINANLEPLKAQISTLIELLNQVIQDNWAHKSQTAGFCNHQF